MVTAVRLEAEKNRLLFAFKEAKGDLFEMYHYSKHNKDNDKASNDAAKATYGDIIETAISELTPKNGKLTEVTFKGFKDLFETITQYEAVPMQNPGEHAAQNNLPYLNHYKRKFVNKFSPLIEDSRNHASHLKP